MLFLKIYRTNGRRRSHENNPPGASPETDPERRRRVHPDRARRRGPAGILRRRIQGRVPRRRTNLPVSRQLDRTALPEPDGVRRHRVGSPGHVVRLGFQLAEPEGGGAGTGMMIVCVMAAMILLAPVALRRERRRREGYKRVKSANRQSATAYERRAVA